MLPQRHWIPAFRLRQGYGETSRRNDEGAPSVLFLASPAAISMRAKLIKVGNSKGIIIPTALLTSCGLKDAVEMQIKGKKLIIEALKKPRAGWFEGYKPEQDTAVIDTIPETEGTGFPPSQPLAFLKPTLIKS